MSLIVGGKKPSRSEATSYERELFVRLSNLSTPIFMRLATLVAVLLVLEGLRGVRMLYWRLRE